ncbi:unnamed protein product [Caenorhabditis brenneri]
MIRYLVLLVVVVAVYLQSVVSQEQEQYILVKLGENATIPLPVSGNYRRVVQNQNDFKDEEHLYRVCNGKNAKTCGFWENVKTKKKVPSGKTQYNKNKKTLIIRGMLASDFGKYMTGNKKKSVSVNKLIVKG